MAPVEDRRRGPDDGSESGSTSLEPFESPIPEWRRDRASTYLSGLACLVAALALLGINFHPGISIRQTTWAAQGEFMLLAGAVTCLGAAYGIDWVYLPAGLLGATVSIWGLLELGIPIPGKYATGVAHKVDPPLEAAVGDVPFLYEILLLIYGIPLLLLIVGGYSLTYYYRNRQRNGDQWETDTHRR